MNKRIYYLIAVCCAFATSCSDNITCNEDIILSQTLAKARLMAPTQSSFSVNEALVNKYISITKPNKTILEVTPVVRNANDTLAYIVQYSQGWDLISGDTRMVPRLAFSETDTLNLEEYEQLGVGGIKGMIDLVAEKKVSGDTIINPMWKFLLPKNDTTSIHLSRASVPGMWVAIDSVYEDTPTIVNHLIQTNWHQNRPYSPIVNGTECKAGCVPVAMGQLLHYYYRNSIPNNISIPSTYNPYATDDNIFSNFSTANWGTLNLSDNIKTFLYFLGKEKLNAQYGVNQTPVTGYSSINNTLNWANLTYQSRQNSYNIQEILTSIRCGSPVLISARNTNGTTNHTFIIDSYILNTSSFHISYEWREGEQPTEWQLQTYPAWMFEPSIKGDMTYEEYVPISEDYSIAMNWGFYPSSYNNIYYTAYTNYYSYFQNGEFITAPAPHQYSPTWQVGSNTYNAINRYYYNIHINN